MRNDRVYAARLISYPSEACDFHEIDDAPEWVNPVVMHWPSGEENDESTVLATLDGDWHPHGWQPPETHPEYRFWWPSTARIYKSRSSAQDRVDLLQRYGAKAELLESELNWLPIVEANARRKAARNAPKIARLEAEIARLKESA